MGFLGMVFSSLSFLGFGYFESPWWAIVGIAVLMFFGGGYLVWSGNWDGSGEFCGVALAVSLVLLVTGILDGWDLFSKPAVTLILYSFVYGTLLKMGRDRREARQF
ncbi:hypothetical protein ACWFR5_16245 [Streptomyces sp. NPDC055092]